MDEKENQPRYFRRGSTASHGKVTDPSIASVVEEYERLSPDLAERVRSIAADNVEAQLRMEQALVDSERRARAIGSIVQTILFVVLPATALLAGSFALLQNAEGADTVSAASASSGTVVGAALAVTSVVLSVRKGRRARPIAQRPVPKNLRDLRHAIAGQRLAVRGVLSTSPGVLSDEQ